MEKILALKNITKKFSGVTALDNVNLNVYKGKSMALVGENGAGKSTIINIIGGIINKDKGQIFWKNNEVNFSNIGQSKKSGIAIVHQELQLASNLTVLENIFLGSEIRTKIGTYNWSKMREEAKKVINALEVDIDVDQKIENLSMGKRQMVEIARAVLFKAELIIMDEPSSSLSDVEIEKLFKVILGLKGLGHSFLYVSHKMSELPIVCDYVTVFRDGKFIEEFSMSNFDESQIITAMIGRKLENQYIRSNLQKKELVWNIKNIKSSYSKNVSLKVYKGEVLGIFGLVGSGRTEFFKTLIGELPHDSGEMEYFGQKRGLFKSPKDAIKNGVYYLTEDRKNEGLFLDFNLRYNTTISSLNITKLKKWFPVVSKKKELQLADEQIENLNVKTSSSDSLARELSGGNQQKVLIGKVLCSKPKVIIFDEPTRGIDVNAKREIYQILDNLNKNGVAIIVISSDLPEILGISNKISLFVEGKLVKNFNSKDATQRKIMTYIVKN